ncbi:hypothetical protein N7478_008897 [Penicillium angulare]|uniref:uncharacterized protein n=1 Tax=Penicillium angulare TaxID=116970 RepID=UPI00254116F2|nr:uncharacterized protein N7478_008897 [Penicillium angulare]KAJ5273772.1 hypothetical protein N7478_008897 [Penicillium angulare]
MSLNTPDRDSSYPPNQREAFKTSTSRIDDQQAHQGQEVPDPVTSPHGTTNEPTIPAVEAHDISAASQHPNFHPFFTLVEDQQTGEYHHPTVHYIFSDDDTDIITAAALRSLESQQDALSSSKREQLQEEETAPLTGEKPVLLPPPIPGVRDNYLVLDVEPVPIEENTTAAAADIQPQAIDIHTGPGQLSPSPARQDNLAGVTANTASPVQFRVAAAKSFSPTWQVLQTEMVPAPRFENNESSDTTGHGLMLKVHGTSGLPYVPASTKDHGAHRLEEMMDQFAKRMSELQTIINSVEVDHDNAPGAESESRQDKEQDHDENERGDLPDDAIGGALQKEDVVERQATDEDE